MTRYIGTVSGPGGLSGPITISIVEGARQIVNGQLQVGTRPRAGLTGFTGYWSPDGTFNAVGANKVSNDPENPRDDVILSVAIDGRTEGTQVNGTIEAEVNGNPATWTFEAYDTKKDARAAELIAQQQDHAGEPGSKLKDTDEGGGPVSMAMGLWDRIPKSAKVVGGVVLAALGVRRLMR